MHFDRPLAKCLDGVFILGNGVVCCRQLCLKPFVRFDDIICSNFCDLNLILQPLHVFLALLDCYSILRLILNLIKPLFN